MCANDGFIAACVCVVSLPVIKRKASECTRHCVHRMYVSVEGCTFVWGITWFKAKEWPNSAYTIYLSLNTYWCSQLTGNFQYFTATGGAGKLAHMGSSPESIAYRHMYHVQHIKNSVTWHRTVAIIIPVMHLILSTTHFISSMTSLIIIQEIMTLNCMCASESLCWGRKQ